MTQPKPNYDGFVAALDALRTFAEGVEKAGVVRDAWRFAYTDDATALARRLEGVDHETLKSLLDGARRLANAVKVERGRTEGL